MTMARYSTTGTTTDIPLPVGGELVALLPSTGGTFWAARPILCIGQTTAICLQADRFVPGTGTADFFLFPVGINLGGSYQLAVDSTGSLWEAGGERSEPDRFFRMSTSGTIDRSAAFPAVGGSTLQGDGTLAIGTGGALWASAHTTSGHDYVIRFTPGS
jgi:hypothetical protein